MKLNEYQEAAHKTANYPASEYPFLCLLEEVGELADKWWMVQGDNLNCWLDEILKEAGDCYWELAECMTCLDLDLSAIECNHELYKPDDEVDEAIKHLVFTSLQMQGLINKFSRKHSKTNSEVIMIACEYYSHNGKTDALRYELLRSLSEIMMIINYIVRKIGSTPEAVMEMNIEKLASRKRRGVIDGSGDDR